MQKEILIPTSIVQIVEGRDSIVLNHGTRSARFVVYTDSVACSICRLKLMYDYMRIVDFHREVGEKFVPIFLFSPSEEISANDVINTLKSIQFNYPVFIDKDQEFPAVNPHIPADSRFHTFLLDKNGKVVLVGDPVNNPALWELYKTTITQLIENDGVMPIVEP